MLEIKGKKFAGYSYADGVHWKWGDEEVAVINENTREIEWYSRPYNLPKEVVDAVRERRPKPKAKWIIEVQPVKVSATQGHVNVLINDEIIVSWGDDSECVEDGWEFESDTENPGKYVTSLLYHKFDNLYHYSDMVRKAFEGE